MNYLLIHSVSVAISWRECVLKRNFSSSWLSPNMIIYDIQETSHIHTSLHDDGDDDMYVRIKSVWMRISLFWLSEIMIVI